MNTKQNVVYKIDNFIRSLIQQRINNISSSGFSMVEMVVTVGLMAVLSTTGVIAYKGYQDNTAQKTVDSAAKDVYNKAYSTIVDEDSTTKPKDVEEEYNVSSENVQVEVEELDNNRIQVRAFYSGKPAITKTVSTPGESSGEVGDTENSNTPEIPVIEDVITTITMRCDQDLNGNILLTPIMGIQEGAIVTIQETDKPETLKTLKLIKYEDYIRNLLRDPAYSLNDEQINQQIEATLSDQAKGLQKLEIDEDISEFIGYIPEASDYKANVTYELKINGKFNILNGTNCFRSIDFANDSGVRAANFGAYVEDVSADLPSSIVSLAGAFSMAKSFNDPDVSKWDVSNVKDMNGMFWNASSFNQPLDQWNTSNVADMYEMFSGASSFNQPLNNWNVSNVENMEKMFYKASSFNQPLKEWNTVKVENMNSMFSEASSFNQNINSWNTSKVKYMSGMFNRATAFNQPLNSWDVSNVENMQNMFNQASSFNQPLNNWTLLNVTNMNGMFYSAKMFSQNLSSWKVTIKKPTSFNNLSPQSKRPIYEQPQWGVI